MKQRYLKYKDQVGCDNVPDYLKYAHHLYPYSDLHHLFGSYTAKKTTDYLIIPLSRTEHQIVEKKKSDYAFEFLPKSIGLLKAYCNLKLKRPEVNEFSQEINLEEVIKLLNFVRMIK